MKKILVDEEIQVDDMSMIEHIHSLQQEIIETHHSKLELENIIRELKLRIHDLESTNYRLKEASPDNEIATIQEELIRVKMREAESSLSLKEMRQRLAEIEQYWAVRFFFSINKISLFRNIFNREILCFKCML